MKEAVVAPYRIVLLKEFGEVHDEQVVDCAHDDEVIDRAGSIRHAHAIDVWQGERQVAHFPPTTSFRPPPWNARRGFDRSD